LAKGGCLRRTYLNLDGSPLGWSGSLPVLEVKLQRLLQVGKRLFFGRALAGDVDFEALGDVPIPLPPNGCSKRSLHAHTLSYETTALLLRRTYSRPLVAELVIVGLKYELLSICQEE